MRSGFARQVSWLSSGRLLASIVQAVGLVLLARSTSPDSVGIVMVFIAFATVPQVIFDAGISTYVIRERAICRTSGSVSYALSIGTRLAACLGVLTFLGLLLLGLIVSPTYWWMLPLSIWIAAERNADLWLGLLLADGDAEHNVLILIARRLITVLTLELFMLLKLNAILGFSIGMMFSALIGVILTRTQIARTLGPRQKMNFSELLNHTKHFWMNSIFAQARNLDSVVTAGLAGTVQAGFYSMSTRLINPLRILPDSLAGVILPNASKHGYEVAGMRKRVWSLVASMSALFILISLSLPIVIPLLLGLSYTGMVAAAQVIVLGLVFGSVASIFNALMMARGHAHLVARITAFTTVFCLVGVAVGASAGAFGAAVGAALSFLVQAIVVVILGFRQQVI